MTALDVFLLERAAAAAPAPASARFVCPDCDDDPACPTCGEPSRGEVLAWLRLIVRGWWSR